MQRLGKIGKAKTSEKRLKTFENHIEIFDNFTMDARYPILDARTKKYPPSLKLRRTGEEKLTANPFDYAQDKSAQGRLRERRVLVSNVFRHTDGGRVRGSLAIPEYSSFFLTKNVYDVTR
ncbi:MAG: hypothetical protein ABSG99_08710 [Sedimentisphaerales bacterium]